MSRLRTIYLRAAMLPFACSLFPISLSANSPYIHRVYEYCPAPGQFINTMPAIADGQDPAQAAEEQIANNTQGMICLGAWGGYVVFGFDHPVVNVADEYDLLIEGNAFYLQVNATTVDSTKGSSEPGIICVSQDINGNGIPDDPWYEIKGSEHDNPLTIRDYQITYYRTPADHVATPATGLRKFFLDTTYVEWRDNQGKTGYVPMTAPHRQDYFPNWVTEDSITFSGTLLPPNGVDTKGTGVFYTMTCYEYGYVDSNPNTSERAKINIDWAINIYGVRVKLSYIDFVKVYTGVSQVCGQVGELSTEISGAQDLHPDALLPTSISKSYILDDESPSKIFRDGMIFIHRDYKLYTLTGQLVQ